MTAPLHPQWLAGRPVSRRRLRLMSRRLADVGVALPRTRLAAIAAGAPATEAERVDIAFAETAARITAEGRRNVRRRARRRAAHGAVVIVAVVVALNLLLSLGLLFFALTAHVGPF
jgi:hypothetical protein